MANDDETLEKAPDDEASEGEYSPRPDVAEGSAQMPTSEALGQLPPINPSDQSFDIGAAVKAARQVVNDTRASFGWQAQPASQRAVGEGFAMGDETPVGDTSPKLDAQTAAMAEAHEPSENVQDRRGSTPEEGLQSVSEDLPTADWINTTRPLYADPGTLPQGAGYNDVQRLRGVQGIPAGYKHGGAIEDDE